MKFVGGTWWELELADGWKAEEHDECLTLTRSDEGAFQVSAAVKSEGEVLPAEVEEQSREGAPNGAQSKALVAGSFTGIDVSYTEDGSVWHRFWLAAGNILLFATYNGQASAWEAEHSDVFQMLSSLRLRSAFNSLPA